MGMIYRDLKPANVLLNADGHIQLVDMGGVIDVGGKTLGNDHADGLHDHPMFGPSHVDISGRLKASSSKSGDSVSKDKGGFSLAPGKGIGNHSGYSVSARSASNMCGRSRAQSLAEQSDLQRANSIMGTYGYMAPEVSQFSYY